MSLLEILFTRTIYKNIDYTIQQTQLLSARYRRENGVASSKVGLERSRVVGQSTALYSFMTSAASACAVRARHVFTPLSQIDAPIHPFFSLSLDMLSFVPHKLFNIFHYSIAGLYDNCYRGEVSLFSTPVKCPTC